MSELAKRIRAKFPGAYDDLDDAALEKAVLAKHPEYADLAQPEPSSAAKPAAAPAAKSPSGTVDPYTFAAKRLGKAALDHPVQALAILGGLAAAPLTGGGSLAATAAASGLGAAGGAGLGSIVNAKRGGSDGPTTAAGVAKTMATEGALGAVGEGIGRAASGALKLAGRGFYRTALQPTQKALSKYGDLVGEGLEQRVPVSASGLEKVSQIKNARLATKNAAVKGADENVGYRTEEIARRASERVEPELGAARRAGLPDGRAAVTARASQFTAANPAGLKPSETEAIKRTLDDQLGGAFRKVSAREPVTPRERFSMALSKELGDAQAESIPGYRDMNRGVMNAEGLRQAVARRTIGSGGNQGLENALTMFAGPSALPARVAMLPPVLSRVGIGAHDAGRVPFNLALKTALIAALGGLPDAPEE